MKVYVFICAIFFIIATLFPVVVSAQDKRFVTISPSVGEVIDSSEATKYGLFQTIENFHSASFYRAADNSLGVLVKVKSADGKLRDSTFAISAELVNEYIQWINHWDELRGTDALPLAPNTTGLSRPMFETIRFDVSIGLLFYDLSGLDQITGGSNNYSIPLSFYIQIPLIEEPAIFFIGGWGTTLRGGFGMDIPFFSSFLLYRPNGFFYLKPIFGLGAVHTSYDYSFNLIAIQASETYPILIFGLNIVPNTLDILFTYPLTKGLSTTFEEKSYTIKLAGPELSLLLSL